VWELTGLLFVVAPLLPGGGGAHFLLMAALHSAKKGLDKPLRQCNLLVLPVVITWRVVDVEAVSGGETQSRTMTVTSTHDSILHLLSMGSKKVPAQLLLLSA